MAESVSFDRVADVYDETRGDEARGGRLARDIAEFLAPGPVIEVGVGTGVVALGLRDLGREVVGVDLSLAMLARARARLGHVVAAGDASALPVASGAFANVVFVHLLHLVGDMEAAIADASRVLRPGGRLIAAHGMPETEPNELSPVVAPIQRLRGRRVDSAEAVAVAGSRAGLRAVAAGHTTPAVSEEAPRSLADQFERRVFSWMWPIDDAEWLQTVEPVIAALRALPDPGRPRRQVRRTQVAVLERPD